MSRSSNIINVITVIMQIVVIGFNQPFVFAENTTDSIPPTAPLDLIKFEDEESPTIPTGLEAVYVTETEVILTWLPATDNIGIKGDQHNYVLKGKGKSFKEDGHELMHQPQILGTCGIAIITGIALNIEKISN